MHRRLPSRDKALLCRVILLPAHDMQARAQLLATLVQQQVPVISFHEVRQTLQENYARSLATPPDLPLH